VATGDADAGLVFATDARAERRRVRVIGEAVPGKDHAPIRYPAAVVKAAPNAPAARRFVAFLRSPAAQRLLARHGFRPVADK
jgi:molybdate transport system substrate-binding protein